MPPVPPQSRAPAERLALRHVAEQAALIEQALVAKLNGDLSHD